MLRHGVQMGKSMNKIIDKVDELIEIIKNSVEYKKYLEMKLKIIENSEIMTLIDEVKCLQKKIINESYKGNEIFIYEKKLNDIIETLNSYPIYVEFNDLQEDLNEQFQYIKNTIQKNIDSI